MTTQRPRKIKALLRFTRLKDGDLVTRLNAVHDGLNGNPNYTTPPVDLATLKSNTDTLATDIAAAEDGGKRAITTKNKQREICIKMLEQLAHYVEANCNDDLAAFTTSGFLAANTTRSAPQPLSQPSIAKVAQKISGQLLVRIQALLGAVSWELRYSVLAAGNTPGNWTNIALPSTKTTTISDLTPGAIYTFQARALGRLGYSDWSDPVHRMCT
jgi:hypothetical protein